MVSYQVTPWLALGAGAQIQRTDARLTNAAFFGRAGEGKVELQADDTGFGFTAGALITPWAGTKLGVGFRSAIDHTLDGDVKINPPVGASLKRDASADLDTPKAWASASHNSSPVACRSQVPWNGRIGAASTNCV